MLTTKNLFSIPHYTFDPLYLFFPSPTATPSPLVTTTLFSVSTCLFLFGLVCSFVLFLFISFLCSTYEWNHMVFVFLWLISLNVIPSRSIHVTPNGKISSLLWLNNIPVCVCVCVCICTPHLLYPFISWWALRLFTYLGYCK